MRIVVQSVPDTPQARPATLQALGVQAETAKPKKARAGGGH